MKGVDYAFLAKMAEEYGVALDTDNLESSEEVEVKREKARVDRMVQMEGVLTQLHHKHALTHKVCKFCQQPFTTNYCYVEYCSDSCRNDEFLRKYGIAYDKVKTKPPQSFWEYEDVIILPPDLTQNLYEYAKFIVDNYDELMRRSQERQEVLREESLQELTTLVESVPEFVVPAAEPEPYTPHNPSEEAGGETQSDPSQPGLGLSDLDFDLPDFPFSA